jgi:L,D-transpeptidase ErfK/SrfK
MWLYEGDAIRKSYRVATCRRGEPSPEGDGTIWAVSFKPTWYPTKNTREYYKKKKRINLPEVVPYGDPNNPLGDFKMSLSHPCDATGLRVYAIHGTPDKSSIGKRASGGCIRMLPDEGLELAKLINAELQAGNQVHVIVTDATVKVVKTPNAMMVPDPFRPEPIATRSAARTSAVTTSVPITPVTIPSAFVSAPTLAGSPR